MKEISAIWRRSAWRRSIQEKSFMLWFSRNRASFPAYYSADIFAWDSFPAYRWYFCMRSVHWLSSLCVIQPLQGIFIRWSLHEGDLCDLKAIWAICVQSLWPVLNLFFVFFGTFYHITIHLRRNILFSAAQVCWESTLAARVHCIAVRFAFKSQVHTFLISSFLIHIYCSFAHKYD